MLPKKSVLRKKTTAELYTYIRPESRFVGAAVLLALEILEERGETFSAEELARVHELAAHKETEENREHEPENFDENAVDDPTAIPLYSQASIWAFSILFSVFAGSVLLALNFRTLGRSGVALGIVAFGTLFTVFQVIAIDYLLAQFSHFGKNALFFSIVGGFILQSTFWENGISKDLKYRKKLPWGAALILGTILLCLYINGHPIETYLYTIKKY